MNKDRWIGVVLASGGVIMCWLTSRITTTGQATANDIGSKFFPYLASAGLILCGIGVIFTGKQKTEPQEGFMPGGGYRRMGILLAIMAVYVVLLNYIGFLIASPVMLFVLVSLLAGERRPRTTVNAFFSISMTVFVYVFFVHVLHILLPPFRLI